MAKKKIRTKGDAIRSMTDRELAEWVNSIEKTAYMQGYEAYKMCSHGEANIEFYTKYFGAPEEKDV